MKKYSFLLAYCYNILLMFVVASLTDIRGQLDILSFLLVDFWFSLVLSVQGVLYGI